MSIESPAPVTPPQPWAKDALLVNDLFPTGLCLIEFDYGSGAAARNGKALGRAKAIVQDIWTDDHGKTRARIDHPVQGDMVLTLTRPDQQPETQTLNLLRGAVIHKIPTDETVRAIVIEVVNKAWNNVVDNSAEALSEVGALRGDLAALQHRVGSLPGLDAHGALEAAIRASEAKVGAVLKQVAESRDTLQKQVEAKLSARDLEIADLRQENRVLRDRLNAIDALLAQLAAFDGAQPTATTGFPGEPEDVVEPVADLNSAGNKLWAEMQRVRPMHLPNFCKRNGLPYPEEGKGAEKCALILASMKTMARFQE